VYDAAGRAVARARVGEGPSLIEVHTLRMWGHFEGDAQGYRPELSTVSEHDPIPRYERALRDAGLLDDDTVDEVKRLVNTAVDDAVEFAKSSAIPDPSTATSYVFA
jgi:TPP-dependent pyruvate/acetoin dehydrogenase alpha subunit